uniref:Uncharacterized protein n=1 Tax=Arundo donax TaxID=35708 RepID=A0A0A8YN29_ARUDO
MQTQPAYHDARGDIVLPPPAASHHGVVRVLPAPMESSGNGSRRWRKGRW